MKQIELDGMNLTIDDLFEVVKGNNEVKLSEESKKKIITSRKLVEKWISENKVIYGITTGCGPMCNRLIPPKKAEEFQKNLIRSHSSGIGDYFSSDIVRAIMLVRANSLANGCSAIRLETLETLIEFINKHIHPCIPEMGSVGASGDLVPLSHMALALMGEGKVEYEGKIMDTSSLLNSLGLNKVDLSYKEGLALINGTSAMTGIGALCIYYAERLLKVAEIAAALCIEVLGSISEPFDEELHLAKPHEGQIIAAKNIRSLIKGSGLIKSPETIQEVLHNEINNSSGVYKSKNEIQDGYSVRCTPQVLGAVMDTIEFVKKIVETEMNSVSDNPLIFVNVEKAIHGGNFHGQHISMAMDYLGIALTEMGTISERRLARLLDEKLNKGLPPFLSNNEAGLQNGFMGIQYVSTSLVAENRVLASPVSIESITTNANNQDIVSMGTIAARKAMRILKNVEYILAVELICAAQAAELVGHEKLGIGTEKAYEIIRKYVKPLNEDRSFREDIETVARLIHGNELLDGVEKLVSLW
jgi:histidine ammonia-lyase